MDGGPCALDLSTAKEDAALSASPPRTNGIAEHHQEVEAADESNCTANSTTGVAKTNGTSEATATTNSSNHTAENNGCYEDGVEDEGGESKDFETSSAPSSVSKGMASVIPEENVADDDGDNATPLKNVSSNATTTINNNINTSDSNDLSNHNVNGENGDIEPDCLIVDSPAVTKQSHGYGAGDAEMIIDCNGGDETSTTTSAQVGEAETEPEPLQTSDPADSEVVAEDQSGETQTNGHLSGHLSDSASPPSPADGQLSSSCSPPLLPAPATAIPPGHYPYHAHHHPHHAHLHHHHHPAATGYYLGTTSPASSSSPSNGGAVSPPIVAAGSSPIPIVQQPASPGHCAPSPPGSYPSSSNASHAGGSGTHSRGDSPGEGGGGGSSPTSGGQHVVHVHVNPGETFSVRLGDQMQHIQGEYSNQLLFR